MATNSKPRQTSGDIALQMLIALWLDRFEITCVLLIAGPFAYFYLTAQFVTAFAWAILVVVVVIRWRTLLWKMRTAFWLKRRWQHAVIRAGAANPPPKRHRDAAYHSVMGPRMTRVKAVPVGYRCNVKVGVGKGTVQELDSHHEKLASCMSRRRFPVQDVHVGPAPNGGKHQAIVTIICRDPFAPHVTPDGQVVPPVPMEWPDNDAGQTSVWDPMPFGITEEGDPVNLSTMGGHVLIGGVTGSGKSVALNLFVAHAALDPTAHLILLDNKKIELAPWLTCADKFIGKEIEQAVEALREVQSIMEARYDDILAGRRETGRKKVGPGETTYHVICDELAFYLSHPVKKHQEAFLAILLDLLQRGRAAGIRVVCAMQRPSASLLDTNLRSQFSHRIAFRTMEAETTQMILGSREAAAHLIPSEGYPGVGYVGGESTRPRRFRAFNQTVEDVDQIAQRAAAMRMDNELERMMVPISDSNVIEADPPTNPFNDEDRPEGRSSSAQRTSRSDHGTDGGGRGSSSTNRDDTPNSRQEARIIEIISLLPDGPPGIHPDTLEANGLKIPRLRAKLSSLAEEGRVGRTGRGVRGDPWLYYSL